MSDSIEVYFSFRSPYSYLATPGMLRLREDFNVALNLRPVLPIAVRSPDFFSPENARRVRYIQLDWIRRAEFLGMPSKWPDPDPIVQNLETLEIASEQPLIYELTALGVEAQRQGKGIEFAKQVSHLIFGGNKDWNQDEKFTVPVKAAGLDLQQMRASLIDGDHRDEIQRNQAALAEAGHWGVPTLVFQGEPFFGQDRIDTLRWRLDQQGLRK
ncbi:MAG: DsbA family protein [Proteobacteria bacterium]|nr:DsbA family protein [Pseudomonadota bacterium]